MDSIIEFIGMYFYKGQQVDCEYFDDYIWEKPWEEITESISDENSMVITKIQDKWAAVDGNLVCFKEDCFMMKIENLISLNPISVESGMQDLIEGLGCKKVFEDFEKQLIIICKEQYAKRKEYIGKADMTLIRILTVWYYLDGMENTTWDFMGNIDYDELAIFIRNKIKLPVK